MGLSRKVLSSILPCHFDKIVFRSPCHLKVPSDYPLHTLLNACCVLCGNWGVSTNLLYSQKIWECGQGFIEALEDLRQWGSFSAADRTFFEGEKKCIENVCINSLHILCGSLSNPPERQGNPRLLGISQGIAVPPIVTISGFSPSP